MQISRRALMLGMVGAPLAACSTAELGSHIDEGGFGNHSFPTRRSSDLDRKSVV